MKLTIDNQKEGNRVQIKETESKGTTKINLENTYTQKEKPKKEKIHKYITTETTEIKQMQVCCQEQASKWDPSPTTPSN